MVSGYMGGETLNPTYESICTGLTGHAEVVQIHFKPEVITYEALLKRFWLAHDPTTLNRQGADVGTQYRSAIFTHSEEQAKVAKASMAEASNLFCRAYCHSNCSCRYFLPCGELSPRLLSKQ